MVVLAKHIPLRKCVSCGKRAEKTSFIRVVRTEEGFLLDETYKQEGRGAYVCFHKKCIEKLQKNRGFHRTFRTNVPNELYDLVVRRSED